jgi:hypothetical protein
MAAPKGPVRSALPGGVPPVVFGMAVGAAVDMAAQAAAAPAPVEPDFAATDPGNAPAAVLPQAEKAPPAEAHRDPRGTVLEQAIATLRNFWNG